MTTLVVMRLTEMARVHPRQIESVCDDCGERVGIYPSGQRVIMREPGTRVLCNYCIDPRTATGLAPGGGPAEAAQSIANPKHKR